MWIKYSEIFQLKRWKHLKGHWGNPGQGKNGCWLYIIVAGVIIMAIVFTIIFNKVNAG